MNTNETSKTSDSFRRKLESAANAFLAFKTAPPRQQYLYSNQQQNALERNDADQQPREKPRNEEKVQNAAAATEKHPYTTNYKQTVRAQRMRRVPTEYEGLEFETLLPRPVHTGHQHTAEH